MLPEDQAQSLPILFTSKNRQLDHIPTLKLPFEQSGSLSTYRSAKQFLQLSQALTAKLRILGQQLDATLSEVLLAAFKVLLYRYTGQSEIAISAVLPVQSSPSSEAIVSRRNVVSATITPPQAGPLVSCLRLIQTQISDDIHFSTLLTHVQASIQTASVYSSSAIEDESTIEQFLSNYSVKVLFSCQETGESSSNQPQIALSNAAGSVIQTETALLLSLQEIEDGINGHIEYNTGVFEDTAITRTIDHFTTLLESILANPIQAITTLPILTEVETHQILVEWNATSTDYSSDRCIHQWIETQVDKTPDAIAVIHQDQQLTYRELNNRANQLAHYLRHRGVKPGALIAICIEPSLEMIVAFLGVLKSGAAYVPLDPAYPHERRAYKLKDAQPQVILTRQALLLDLPETPAQVVQLDAEWDTIAQQSQTNPTLQTTPQDLAYVIYTSGSTGKPKGVMITHQGMVNHSAAIVQSFELQQTDWVLQFSSMSFDIIVEEVFPSLVAGAALVIRDKNSIASTTSFLQFIGTYQITVLNLPTAFWHELVNGLSLLDTVLPPTVRLLVVGGEKASRSSYLTWCQQVGSQVRWLNTYGPTETTVTATIYDPIASGFASTQSEIPIGRPIANAQIYILDAHLQPVPIGVPGELYIGGAGLGRGYLNRPDLTASKFVANPFSSEPDSRLYKTGDTARYLPDGNIEFIGRIDYQVKIRGFRIELGEVESALEQHPSVQQAVVIADEEGTGHKRLLAYVVVQPDQLIESSALKEFLQKRLPDYMIPAHVTVLESFPLTPNGKVDRRALPAPTCAQERGTVLMPPRDDLEFQLVQIWENVLEVRSLGIEDNFFDLGGNSLLAARLSDRLEQVFDCHLPLTTIFQTPTIAQLAEVLRQNGAALPDTSIVAIQPEGTQMPLFLCEGICIYSPLKPYLGADQPLYGLATPHRHTLQGIPKSVEELAADYVKEIRAIQPHGPYRVGGLSFGGTVAFEVAQQLIAQGEEVALVVLFDTSLPDAHQLLPFYKRLRLHLKRLAKAGVVYGLERLQHRWQLMVQRVHQRDQQSDIHPQPRSLHTEDYLARNLLNDSVEQRYQPKPYPGQVVIFRATDRDDAATTFTPPDLGWGQFAQGELTLYDTPGDHLSILREPHVQLLGRQLHHCLQSVS